MHPQYQYQIDIIKIILIKFQLPFDAPHTETSISLSRKNIYFFFPPQLSFLSETIQQDFSTYIVVSPFRGPSVDYHIFYDTLDTRAIVFAPLGSRRKWKCMRHTQLFRIRDTSYANFIEPTPSALSSFHPSKYQFVRSRFDSVRRPFASSSILPRCCFHPIGFLQPVPRRGFSLC